MKIEIYGALIEAQLEPLKSFSEAHNDDLSGKWSKTDQN